MLFMHTTTGGRVGACYSCLKRIQISDIPHPPNTHLALYADDTALLVQSWRTDTVARRLTYAMDILHRYFTKWKLRVNVNKTEALLFTKRRPIVPPLTQFQHTMIPWNRNIRYLGLTLDPKLFSQNISIQSRTKPPAYYFSSSPSLLATQR